MRAGIRGAVYRKSAVATCRASRTCTQSRSDGGMWYYLLVTCLLAGTSWAWPVDRKQANTEKNATSPYSLDWDNTIAICAIMRQENLEDLREWLQYHRYIGVDQVLLYDNNENGGEQAADLADFIKDGFLTYFTVPGQAKQIPVYHHCLMHSSEQYTWLAAIDIDEFIVVEDKEARLRQPEQHLKTVLRDFRFYPALWLQWKGFGPGYHHDRPSPGGPLKHYTHCMPLDWPPANMHRLIEQGIPPDAGQAVSIVKYGKTIANRYWASHASTAHGFMYWGGAMPVTDAMQRVPPALDKTQTRLDHAEISFTDGIRDRNKRIVVHHYASRSFEDYQTKLARGAGDHNRSSHLRGMGFFNALNESTFKHPVCESAVAYADNCCRDKYGNPWPPVPKDVSRDDYTINELQPDDVPSLDDMHLNRGLSFREGHLAPFPQDTWKASIVICARWDPNTDEGALREWLDHHKYIGVTKVLLYVDDKNPSAETDAIKNYSPKFLRWRTLEDDRRQGEDDSHFVRRRCMKQAADAFAYMVYLNTYDYIMPRGAGKNSRGQLTTLLSINEFRYGPGVVLPVFEFGKFDLGTDSKVQLYPLRHFKDCTYFGHNLMTRTIANTYYVEAPTGDMDFKFVYGMLPVTDTRIPWVPLLVDIPTDDDSRIFPQNIESDESMLEAQMKRFHLSKPFGDQLAVFSFPPEPAEPVQQDQWRYRWRQYIVQRHSNDPSCREALQAADACCRWEEDAKQ